MAGLPPRALPGTMGVSSIEGDCDGGEVCGLEEDAGGFVVSGCDGAELFELGEDVLDAVPGFVEVAVEGDGMPAMALGRDHGRFAGGAERFDEAGVGVIGAVGQEGVGSHAGEQGVAALQGVGLTAGEAKGEWVSQGVHQGVDLGAQAGAGSADGLADGWIGAWVGAPLLAAPALC